MSIVIPSDISVRELQEFTEQALDANDPVAAVRFIHARLLRLEEPATDPGVPHPPRKMTPPGGYRIVISEKTEKT